MFAIADEVLDLCRSVGHEATVLAVLADGLRNGPSDGAVLPQAIRDAPLQPACPLSNDAMSVVADYLPPEVVINAMANGEPAPVIRSCHS